MAIKNQYQKLASLILFVLALLLFFKIIQPVITIILSSILLSYISFPVYKKIREKIPNKTISIIISLLIVVVIILIPFSFLAIGIGQQGYYFYDSLSNSVAIGAILGVSCNSEDSKVCFLINQIEKFSLEQLSKFGFDKQLQSYMPVLEEKIKDIIFRMPFIIAQLFITLIITFFILDDSQNIFKRIKDILPIGSRNKKKLISDFEKIAYSVIYAQLFVALVQGLVGMIGFYLFGVPFPILSGVLIAFFALIPFFGTSMIWMPASLYLVISGYFSHDYWVLGKGIGLLLYGIFIIATIDNILLAKIVKAKTNVSPIIIIIGVLGGVGVFGIIGLFIGPILLPLLITYFEMFKERKSDDKKSTV